METPPSIPGSVMPPPAPAPAPKSGGGKWVIIGCGGCLTLLVLCGLFAAGIFWTVSGTIKSSDAYQEALKRAQQSPEVRQALGTPITTNWMFEGSINYADGEGTAKFKVPLTGPKGEASLVAEADKKVGEVWHFAVLEVRVPDGPTIDLRESTGPP